MKWIGTISVAAALGWAAGSHAQAPADQPAYEGPEIRLDYVDGETVQLAALQDDVGDLWGPEAGDWDFSISGNGTSDEDFDTNVFGFAASIGYYFTEHFEVGVRQSLNFVANGESAFNGSTRVFLDYNFDLDHWRPFVGGSFGGTYGDTVVDTWMAGIEGGVKWYVKPETYVFGMVEWLWFFEDSDQVEDAFDDGQFVYTLGVGFNF